MNSLERCSFCTISHVNPEDMCCPIQLFKKNPIEEGLDNVLRACGMAQDCGKALKGNAFEKFTFNRETKVVSCKLEGKEFTLLTSNGFDGENEIKMDEIHQMIIDKFKEVIANK